MSSIIEGYIYDIFISYRQKDNKGDHWVSEFVEALKTELESTFKEEISVYFDNNPHDGLLETHEVDASLREKLKCLIFIPIISRTYCDPKSFAWEHEFKAFVELASNDQFGLKVKLPIGNVASRVLPVRIHDLKKEDISICEEVLGSVLRGVEFIYKSTGVNRPLTANEDHINDNLNKTYYRDQINKTGRSIQEIIDAMTFGSEEIVQKYKTIPEKPVKEVAGSHKSKRQEINKYAKYAIPFILITAILFLLLKVNAVKNIFQNHQGEEILNRAIRVVDPSNSWPYYYGKIRLRTIRINAENEYNEIIEIRTANDDYKRTSITDTSKTVTGFYNGKFFGYSIRNKGDTTNYHDGENSQMYYDTRFMRRHHYCQFGILMELKKSGMIMDEKVKKEKFQGKSCFALHFRPTGSNSEDDYFRGNITVYIDPSNYFMKGYKVEISGDNISWDIVFTGNIRVSDLNIPLCKIYYNNIDNSFLWMDIITPEN